MSQLHYFMTNVMLDYETGVGVNRGGVNRGGLNRRGRVTDRCCDRIIMLSGLRRCMVAKIKGTHTYRTKHA